MPSDASVHPIERSPLHRWRMPEKWLGFLALMLAVSAAQDVRAALLALTLAAGVFAIGRCGGHLPRVLQASAPLLLLIVPATALAVTPRAQSFWGITYSAEGLRVGLLIVLRCLALLLLAAALVSSTASGDLFAPLRRLGVPRRLVEVLWMAERFVYGVSREGRALQRAAVSRGYALSARPRALRTFGVLAGAHLVRSLQRSERVHVAMCARGYAGDLQTGELRRRTMADMGLLAVFLVLALALVFLRGWR